MISAKFGKQFCLATAALFAAVPAYASVPISTYGGSTSATPAANCTAFNNAGASGQLVTVPGGTYQTGCTISVGTTNGGGLIGDGSKTTTIQETTNNIPVLKLTDSSANTLIQGFTVVHSGTAAAGGNGIDLGSGTNQDRVFDIVSYGNYIGVIVKSAAYGTLRDVIAQNSVSDGFNIANTPSLGAGGSALGWMFDTTLSQANGGWGYHFLTNAVSGLYAVTLQPLNNLYTFSNGLGGVYFQGNSTTGISDIIMNGGFFGTDGGPEINVDAYGDNRATFIRGITTEINATGNTINITGNNGPISVSDAQVNNPPNGFVGIFSAANYTTVSNPKVLGNNVAGATTVGIQLNGNFSEINGGRATTLGTGVIMNGASSALLYCDTSGNLTHARAYGSGVMEQSVSAAASALTQTDGSSRVSL
jgi:hypothetical protein